MQLEGQQFNFWIGQFHLTVILHLVSLRIFRIDRSTEDATVHLRHLVFNQASNNRHSDILNKGIICPIPYYYNLLPSLLPLQQARLGSTVSETVSVISSVSQGSIRGPYLFKLYTNSALGHFAYDKSIGLQIWNIVRHHSLDSFGNVKPNSW